MRRLTAERAGSSDQRGLTFTEVAASLLTLSVLMLASAPIFSQVFAVYHLRSATQEIFAELQRTRLSAVMANTRQRLYVVDGSAVYKIHDDSNHNNAEDSGEVMTRTIELDSPGTVLTGTDAVTFLPNGTALTYGTITITSRNGRTKTVTVSSGGRIRIQ
jgi:Tfp pilus assembly protein FimT